MARHCAQEGLDCPRDLFRLCELELLDREQRAIERRSRAAKWRTEKRDRWDFRHTEGGPVGVDGEGRVTPGRVVLL